MTSSASSVGSLLSRSLRPGLLRRDVFVATFRNAFGEVVPAVFRAAWNAAINIFRLSFISPFERAWFATPRHLRSDLQECLSARLSQPYSATRGTASLLSSGRTSDHPFERAWFATRDIFVATFRNAFGEVVPAVFRNAWDSVITVFRQVFISPFATAWFATRDIFVETFRKRLLYREVVPSTIFRRRLGDCYRSIP